MGNNKTHNGWKMLDSYSEGEAIYGRDEEILQISDSIRDNIQTFIYGKSGIGKTSLIQAGVFPRLRQSNLFPVIIRLSFYREGSLRKVVKRLIEEEAAKENTNVGKPALTFSSIDGSDLSDSTLFEYFAKMCFSDVDGNPYVPVLIFDQFEETINNEDNWQRTVDFLVNDLYDLLDDSINISSQSIDYTNYRIVLSMREDYLYCLEDIIDTYALWELRYNRYRVKSLDDTNAADVIRLTCGVDGLESGYEDKIVKTIIKLVKINSGTRFKEINTALLSLVCSLLSENAPDGCIRLKDLGRISAYLTSYYDNICDKVGSRATRYLETHLLTKDGRRSSVDESEAIASRKISMEQLDYLVEQRLLRRIKTDTTSIRYEYIHDLFARMIHKRMREETRAWYRPAFQSIARKSDVGTFIKQLAIALPILLFFSADVILDPILGINNPYTYKHYHYHLLFILAYVLPSFVKRLHDVGYSGWYMLIVPFSLFLLVSEHYFGFIKHSMPLHIASFTLLGILLVLCLLPSNLEEYSPKCSLEYQSVASRAFISNKKFIKLFSIEFMCWCICCLFDKWYYCYQTNAPHWWLHNSCSFALEPFHIAITPFNSIFPLSYQWLPVAPAFVALFPVVLCFSPSLHARARTMGHKEWQSYIPLYNILLLAKGFCPDSLLKKLHLIKPKEHLLQSNSDSGSLFELFDELPTNSHSSMKRNKEGTSIMSVVGQLLIPFLSVAIMLNNKMTFGKKMTSSIIAFINWYFGFVTMILVPFIFNKLGMNMDAGLLYVFVFLGAQVVLLIILIIMAINVRKLLRKAILETVSCDSQCTKNQIGKALGTKQNIIEQQLRKLQENGKIERILDGESFVWVVKKKK